MILQLISSGNDSKMNANTGKKIFQQRNSSIP